MKLKKFLCFAFLICFLPCIIFPLTACNPNKMYSTPTKITDYLYSIEYTNYKKDVEFKTITTTENVSSSFGCSSVRKGNFYGRNFDYIYNDIPEFIVKLSATRTRHASIGVATHFGLIENKMDTYTDELELIPNFTLDGINDCGVICSHNVVKIEEDNLNMIGTNPNGEDLHMLFIPRFVLDNASSADEAVKLIKSRNIIGNLQNKDYLHIMIADKNKTYVVEFYKGGVLVEEKKNDKQIMTNYYLNLPEINEHPLGLERYQILQSNYNSTPETVEGMQNLMQLVKYSEAYNPTNAWYSEILTKTEINQPNRNTIFLERGSQNETAFNNKVRSPANPEIWHTVHNSTYDLENKKLYVFVQENYATNYVFEL